MAEFFRIEDFSLYRVSGSDPIFVSNDQIIRVTSPHAEAVLCDILEQDRKLIPSSDFQVLCQKHNVDSAEITGTFTGAITRVERTATLGKTVVLSDNKFIHDVVNDLSSEYGFARKPSSGSALTVVFFDVYDAERIRSPYRTASAHDLFLTCHLHDHHFIIDGMYRRDLKLPCHFCHRESFTARRIARYGASEDQWSTFMHSLGLLDPLLEPRSYQLNTAARQLIAGTIYFRLKNLLNGFWHKQTSRPGFWTSISLRTGETASGVVPHHPQCGCTTGEW